MLNRDSKIEKTHLKTALRNYFTDCLFQCDEGGLPDEALRAIAFINRISGRQQVLLAEERKEVECWSETVGDAHNVSGAEDSGSKSEEMLRKSCFRTEYSGGVGHYSGNEAVVPYADKSVDENHFKKSKCSEIKGICDETSIVAHKLIGQILDKWLLVENNEVDKPTRCHLGSQLVSQTPRDDDSEPNSAENQEGNIFIHAVEHLLPNLPKRFCPLPSFLFCRVTSYDFNTLHLCSCINKVKRLIG
ncbi:hypothetical protein HU200_039133 [Digitaria exilis]|uniref:Uncharacterized protein n=1 Tax=Digitaria exilis TaxID=1010633 RepID=A0A835BBY5_9POAL|nr:hypothetical protein HU200_039133 [Digitaria exilis]